MSTNNLEVRVNELTNAVRNLSSRPMLTSGDINNLLNNLSTRFENINSNSVDNIQDLMLNALEKQRQEVQERFSTFETFIASVEKVVQNPKLDSDITRILNDIEALYSKMNNQELIYDSVKKGLETLKNSSASIQITKLSDEILSISKSYDGIAEVLNNNFEEFLKRVETLSSREEFQRLRYYLETIESNQNVLVSAMNVVSDKQEEIKNIIRQSGQNQTKEKFEQLQTDLAQIEQQLIDLTSKKDLELVESKINAIFNLLSDIKSSIDNPDKDGVQAIIQTQLNKLIGKIEELKIDSNSSLGEDIIRLYTSVAEFKEGIFSTLNNKLNEISSNFDASFDKISSSLLNSNISTNDNVTNMIGEVQKLNSILQDDFTSKADDIKQEIEKTNQASTITVINAIKSECDGLLDELSHISGKVDNRELLSSIEAIKNSSNKDEILSELKKIQDVTNFETIAKELSSIVKSEELAPIYQKLEALNELNSIKENIAQNAKSEEIIEINQKLNALREVEQIKAEISTVSKSDEVNAVSQKLEHIKEILNDKTTHDVSETYFKDIQDKLSNLIEVTGIIQNNSAEEKIKDVNDKVSLLVELIKNISNVSIEEQINALEQNVLTQGLENAKRTTDFILEFQTNIQEDIEGLKKILESNDNSASNDAITSAVTELEAVLHSKLSSICDIVENIKGGTKEEVKAEVQDSLNNFKPEIKELIKELLDKAEADKFDSLSTFIKNQSEELKIDISSYLKQEAEILTTLTNEKNDALNNEILEKIARIADIKDNSKDKEEISRKILEDLYEVINSSNVIKTGIDESGNILNELKERIEDINANFAAAISKNKEELINLINQNAAPVESAQTDKLLENGYVLKENLERLSEVTEEINEKVSINSDKINKSIEDKFDLIGEHLELIGTRTSNLSYLDNNSNIEEHIKTITDKIESHCNEIKDFVDLKDSSVVENIKLIGENIASINSKVSKEENTSNITEEIKNVIDDIRKEFQEAKDTAINELKEEIQKITEKNSSIEELIEYSTENSDNRVLELLTSNREIYKENLDEKTEALSKKFDEAISEIYHRVDEKVYEIISRNNDIIRDELKMNTTNSQKLLSRELEEKISKIENYFSNSKEENSEHVYTMADMETDIAKIKIGLEKNNKLSNFKEFATRLVELKNINLESAKISRAIGSDIMRFDNWIKNATAKIDHLAAKIEKSDKIRMEDYKARIMQGEKNNISPHKLEEVLTNVYKKYRIQEMKIEELMSKIDSVYQKQNESFNAKEFIDIFYDNTQKTQGMVARMDALEDKIDLIQAKIDHIISSCIDE